MPDISVERTINASPEAVWALVSDPTSYGKWSPENTGAKWVDGATGAAVGAKFKGSNAKGWMKWSTGCTVTQVKENERFAFSVKSGPMPIADWAYELEAVDGGTKVTETWTRTEPKVPAWVLDKAMRVPNRAELNRSNMAATLDAMAAELEG